MGVSAADIGVFLVEIAFYVAVMAAAWHAFGGGAAGVATAVAALLVMATWWGLCHSPRARIHLPLAADRALRVLWFGVGVAAGAYALGLVR